MTPNDINDITISLFGEADEAMPSLENDLERLYQSLYSTLAHHRAYGGLQPSVNTYVARKNGRPLAILLLRREKDTVRVLNEQIRLDEEELSRFARYIFDTFDDVNVIVLHAVEVRLQRLDFPCQQFHCTEDIVLDLPDSTDAYRGSLGKSTRSYIQRYQNKLRRDFPGMHYAVHAGEEIDEAQVRSIIELNRARMADKNRTSYIDDLEAERIVHFARRYGLMSVMSIDGRVCAGAISFRIGDNYFLKVIAHDPAYNDYRLGTLCCYLTICECIARGGKEYHFLWGRYEYKYRLLGVQRDLDHVTLYRSHLQMGLNGRQALGNACKGTVLRARSWVLQRARDNDRLGMVLKSVLSGLQGAKSRMKTAISSLKQSRSA
ncbi:GNAT family N-acetyltransferase [Noviherbaspirillum saxi]|nr:GNAT family N-acetyltransferase [Noviherbaspirillum saxi]